MTVNAITDTKKGRTGIAPTYLHTTQKVNRSTITYKIKKQTSASANAITRRRQQYAH